MNKSTTEREHDVVDDAAGPETVVADNSDEGTTPKRHKRAAVNKWKKSIIKEKHLKGEAFKNRKGQERQAKTIGPPCKSEYCRKINAVKDLAMKHILPNSYFL